ncbi:hypothetical protein FHS83_003373 [Rhizomicrobium palustre]|uniref:Uncharacterized protein n=1 Tax=Rhizomicrobium palustre TaxID=189966 RepID=A0A846N3K5_9PROT|nr:hypothetical protein [Rhizomicrobium palustre]NIK90055.1 hypothetical protein [Rhizomicrobium palustre]
MTITLPLNVTFTGADADQHRLPAYNATESLDGIARTTLIVANYIAEGRVRYRDFKYSGYSFDILAVRAGSFDVQFVLTFLNENGPILSGLAMGVAGNFASDFLKAVFRRAIGKSAPSAIETLEAEDKLDTGDMGALVEAVAPAIKRAHRVINYGAGNIAIVSGSNNVVSFDHVSKQYVEASFKDGEVLSKLFSVGSYNANTRHGRVYDYELHQTIAFDLSVDADIKTTEFILESFSSYALSREGRNMNSAIALRYTRVLAVDGRIKKIFVLKAREDIEHLVADHI